MKRKFEKGDKVTCEGYGEGVIKFVDTVTSTTLPYDVYFNKYDDSYWCFENDLTLVEDEKSLCMTCKYKGATYPCVDCSSQRHWEPIKNLVTIKLHGTHSLSYGSEKENKDK